MTNRHLSRRRFLGATASLLAAPAISSIARASANDYDVIILGAGLAGLNAARHLEAAGYRIAILEARDQVGGRVRSEKSLNGIQELGGQSMTSAYARVVSTAEELGLSFYVPGANDPVLTRRGSALHIGGTTAPTREAWANHASNPFSGEARTSYPWERLRAVIAANNPLEIAESWQEAAYQPYDISLASMLRNTGMPEAEIRLVADTNPAYGDGANEISALMHFYNAAWIKRLIELMANGRPGSFQIVGGNQMLPKTMATNLKGDLRLGFPVSSIKSSRSGVTVSGRSEAIRSKAVISTLPLKALSGLKIDAPLLETQRKAFKSIPYSRVHQVFFEIQKPFWEQDGLPNTFWTDTPVGRLFMVAGDDGKPAYVKTWATGKQAAYLDSIPNGEATALLQQSLWGIRPSTKGAVKAKYLWSWQQEAFSGGTYAAWGPGQITSLGPTIGAPAGRLLFAGEHTAKLDRGMEGAMESGERAAYEAMDFMEG